MADLLDEILMRLKPALMDEGVFWPMDAAPRGIRTSDTVKRHLKAAGLAIPAPQRDGFWVLTEEGRRRVADRAHG